MNCNEYLPRIKGVYQIFIAAIVFSVLISFLGCKSINVGGSGQIGGVYGGGGVTIPVPPQTK
mgnify:CR=1 FL=1